jgi:hypothetical protein
MGLECSHDSQSEHCSKLKRTITKRLQHREEIWAQARLPVGFTTSAVSKR